VLAGQVNQVYRAFFAKSDHSLLVQRRGYLVRGGEAVRKVVGQAFLGGQSCQLLPGH